MFDTPAACDRAPEGAPQSSASGVKMQRAEGVAMARFSAGRLQDLHQKGCGKALLPNVRGVPEVVFLNTSGGLTSGDSLSYSTQTDSRLIATTQAAERAYRADHGPAHVSVRHEVAGRAMLDWLPQETILFDRANLSRDTVISLAPEAGCVMLEAVVLGRAAMGETVRELAFSDRRQILRAGLPVFYEPFALRTEALALGPRSALLGPARAFATLVLCAQGAEDAVTAVREVLHQPDVEGAASGFDGKCIVRLLAGDGWPLRRQILAVMNVLRQGEPAPRVWQL